MKIPHDLPITPLQSKAARFQLGLTQANVIQDSGLPGHKLKGFETGRLIPDMPFLEALAAFYQNKGIDLSDLAEGAGLTPATAAATKPISPRVQSVPAMAFRIALPFDQVDEHLERMEKNDERIEEIFQEEACPGIFSDHDERTEALQRELFGLMAANYLIFRNMQGRPLIGTRTSQKKTQFDICCAWLNAADIEPLVSADSAEDVDGEEAIEEEAS